MRPISLKAGQTGTSGDEAEAVHKVTTGPADRGADRPFQTASIAARAVDRYFPAVPDAHAQAVNAPRTARLESSAAKPNVPPTADPLPSDQRPPHLPPPAAKASGNGVTSDRYPPKVKTSTSGRSTGQERWGLMRSSARTVRGRKRAIVRASCPERIRRIVGRRGCGQHRAPVALAGAFRSPCRFRCAGDVVPGLGRDIR